MSETLKILSLTHNNKTVRSVAFSPDGQRALSSSHNNTVRLWDIEDGRCLRVLKGHSSSVLSVAWSYDGRRALSGSSDCTVSLWDVDHGRCLSVLAEHTSAVHSVAWNYDGRRVYSAAYNGVMRVWDLEGLRDAPAEAAQVQYTNAKVLFVGDSGVGKTGLARYLAHGLKDDESNSSTDGAWASHWPLPHSLRQDGVDREIWLWDFAGQVDYRLVHQLFMDETSAAVLVFNPQTENPFEGLGQWDRDLYKATRTPFAKLLAAGRIDRGGLVVSDSSLDRFMAERGFLRPLHRTSAKTGEGCEDLCRAILDAIDWDRLPITTSLALYQHMKEEILRLRDTGEIEFKDDSGRATGKRLYLQLKSGDSYLTERKGDGAKIFKIKNPRWVDYWQQQAYPVMLVIRTSDGAIQWMDVSAWLKQNTAGGRTVKQIVFEGETFDASTLRRWRDRVLGLRSS